MCDCWVTTKKHSSLCTNIKTMLLNVNKTEKQKYNTQQKKKIPPYHPRVLGMSLKINNGAEILLKHLLKQFIHVGFSYLQPLICLLMFGKDLVWDSIAATATVTTFVLYSGDSCAVMSQNAYKKCMGPHHASMIN